MSLPIVNEGLGFITFDQVNTNNDLLSKQQNDLSGNETQRQFCIDAFHLAGNIDVSNALLSDVDINLNNDNTLAYIGSNDKDTQKSYLSSGITSSLSQNLISNAYKMIEGIQLNKPLNALLLIEPEPEPEPIPEPEPMPEPMPEPEPMPLPPFSQLITQQKIVASDRQTIDQFGYSVVISGNYAIVGAHYEDHDASGNTYLQNPGSAYIFENTNGTWSQVQKIVTNDRAENDFFGHSVAISGNYVIVGARGDDSGRGSAYIFENTNGTWSQIQKIVASDRAESDRFGWSVAISGNYAIVGAYLEDSNGLSNAGSAYIYERNTDGSWNEVQKIVASDRATDDYFGYSVAISGNYAIVGAYSEDPDGITGAGSAYIFEINTNGTWNEVQKIVASDRQGGDYFGISVAISGNYAIVGAYLEDHDENGQNTLKDAGSAYIFERDTNGTWPQTETQKIVASDRAGHDRFGWRVAIDGSYVIVGAYNEDPGNIGDAGSAYIFENTNGTWSQLQKIVASDRAGNDRFGWSVAISGNYAIVGATGDDGNIGSAYIFEG